MDAQVIAKAKSWLNDEYDVKSRTEVESMLADDPELLYDSFYKNLEFGTGGLRGLMGAGTNRMNIYTVASTTQGLSNYLKKIYNKNPIRVAIAFDSRNNSELFAKTAADVLSANGIEVFIFHSMRPTPLLSFAVRKLECHSGIVITASHNPPEYNGYKVYWDDGSQLVAPHDKNILHEVNKIKGPADILRTANSEMIHTIDQSIDDAFLNNILQLSGTSSGSDLKIVYTPLHGTGIVFLPKALQRAGFNHVITVEQQAVPDGNFPSIQLPNPEEPAALKMAMDIAEKNNSDLVIGTDPDADRVGAAYRNTNGRMQILNGNLAAALQTFYLLEKENKKGTLTKNAFIATTIVTTEMIDAIAKAYGIQCFRTLTGFKHIAAIIRQKGEHMRFICGSEESCGFMAGDYVRDKDAITSALIMAGLCEYAKKEFNGMEGLLMHLFQRFGCYANRMVSITKEGVLGNKQIAEMMDELRSGNTKAIGNVDIIDITDYLKDHTGLPPSNVMQFRLADHSLITARPSGTEPKIKFYFSVREPLPSSAHYTGTMSKLEKKIDRFIAAMHL